MRRQTEKHPFEILEAWMGDTHILTRTLDRVRAEMSLVSGGHSGACQASEPR